MVQLEQWLQENPLSAIEVDCSTTVMLKILDGKCKMSATDKVVMATLYDAVKHLPGDIFDSDMHAFIDHARNNLNETLKLDIYEKRVLAETMLSRPVMKAFKARIRTQGLFEVCNVSDVALS